MVIEIGRSTGGTVHVSGTVTQRHLCTFPAQRSGIEFFSLSSRCHDSALPVSSIGW